LSPAIKLAVCVAFHFVPERFQYLDALCANFPALARELDVTIVTNAQNEREHKEILAIGTRHGLALSLFVPRGMGHPYLLPWSHFEVMREKHAAPSFTHFMYLEDDLLVRQETILYLLQAREFLRTTGLLPSVLRVEQKTPGGQWYATDVTAPIAIDKCSKVVDQTGAFGFFNIPELYQAMYFLDRESMTEHLSGRSSNPDFGIWKIRERAAQGLTFSKVPEGFASRIMVPYHVAAGEIDERCLVHHLPNNYATNPKAKHAKIKVVDLLQTDTAVL